jgi:hypothetical protein
MCEGSHRSGAMSDEKKSREETLRGRVFSRYGGVSVRCRECITRDLRSDAVVMECEVRDEWRCVG